jgi:hypothetical protein
MSMIFSVPPYCGVAVVGVGVAEVVGEEVVDAGVELVGYDVGAGVVVVPPQPTSTDILMISTSNSANNRFIFPPFLIVEMKVAC